MRAGTLALILVLAGPATAQDHLVYRCRDAGSGHLSFQSGPCGADQVQERTYDATPDRVSPVQEADNLQRNLARPAATRAPVRTRRPASRRSGRTAAADAVIGSSAECRQMRAARDRAYREEYRMGYRERQRWGDRLRQVCR